ncbi:MAG: flagellar hook protein FlgE [Alphaproteobacteria bacterium]
MSLFGSLFSGVSGLNAQSTAMGIISDNIANVNTVGYKATQSRFSTLVTQSATENSYSSGGVRAAPYALVSQQGLLQSSASALDIAISGNGFFVVNSAPSSNGDVLYTRAGSFHPDELGNLVNTAGVYLQGWPLDSEGRLPGQPGNINTTSSADLSSLQTINVSNVNGIAAETTTVEMGANLTASEPIHTGPQDTTLALGVTASADLSAAGLSDGDSFTVTSGSVSQTFVYRTTPALATEFNNLTELAAAINAVTGLSATIEGAASDAQIVLTGIDPREDLVVTNTVGTAAVDLFGGTSPITIDAVYDPANSEVNMASGTISPDFSRAVRVFDAQGTGHDVQVAFLKVAQNTWAVEIFATPASDVEIPSPFVDGQLATGTLTFNGDATLGSITQSLSDPIDIAWTSGATPSSVTFDWGTAGTIGVGRADGISQFDSPYNVSFVNQNGSEVGQLNGVSIDDNGFVVASFSNGETTRLYKLPIATFADPSQLSSKNGNVFSQSDRSGEFNLREAGKGSAGLISPSSLEAANVDLGKEFTDMIITQRAFTASSKVLTTADEMLDELVRIRR